MVIGVGTDLVTISRVAAAWDRHGERFARKILNLEELKLFSLSAQPARELAKHFAVKEAVVKALGTGFSQGVSWQHITLYRNDWGKPLVSLAGAADFHRQRLGGQSLEISISDERDQVLAFAVLSRLPGSL